MVEDKQLICVSKHIQKSVLCKNRVQLFNIYYNYHLVASVSKIKDQQLKTLKTV